MTTDKKLQEIIHRLSYHPNKRLDNFRLLNFKERRDVMLRLTKHIQYDIFSKLEKEEAVNLLEQMDNDEATDLLQLLPAKKRTVITNELNEQLKTDISLLLKFDPETAAGLMNIDYILIESDDTIATVARQVKVHEKRTGKLPAILVMEKNKLIGYLPGHQLGFGKISEKAKKYVKKIKTIKYNAEIDRVLEIFRHHPHNKIVVIGEKGNILGIIYSDDILRVVQERESSSLYDFAGVHDEESVFDNTRRKVKFRYKWLILNIATAFLAAFTVGLFDATISKYVLLAVYMPIVAGMGGNAAAQTLAIMVRGIALKQIKPKNILTVLKNELGSGSINGIINGLIVASVVIIKDHDIKIAFILAVAMIINLLVAAFFGTLIPLLMKSLGKDPASSASIFITTATDVLGFLAFLGLATLILD